MTRLEGESGRERAATSLGEERAAVRVQLEGRLIRQGVRLTGDESDDQLASLSEAVERFEDAVIAIGGDRMIDSTESAEPEHPDQVLPARRDDEAPESYARRVRETADRIGSRGS